MITDPKDKQFPQRYWLILSEFEDQWYRSWPGPEYVSIGYISLEEHESIVAEKVAAAYEFAESFIDGNEVTRKMLLSRAAAFRKGDE